MLSALSHGYFLLRKRLRAEDADRYSDSTGKGVSMLQVILLLSAAALVGLDQGVKYLVSQTLAGQPPYVLIPGVFELHYSQNDGAAFGLFPGQQWILIGLTSLLMLVILGVLLSGKFRRYKMVNLCGVLIVAGGVGNLIDRLVHGYVIDFLYFKAINFPIFNLADTFVVCGAVLFLIYFLFVYRESGEKAAAPEKMSGRKSDVADQEENTANSQALAAGVNGEGSDDGASGDGTGEKS